MSSENACTKNRLHLGCGLTTPVGWINIDGSWNARLAKHPVLRRIVHSLHLISADKLSVPWDPAIFIHDVRLPLPFPPDSAEVIYSSHLLEHLYFEEAKELVRECFRVLAPGGVLRIVVPDLRAIIREYLGDGRIGEPSPESDALRPADRVNRRLLMRPPAPPNANWLYRVYTAWKDFHQHKWMYDADSLKALFESAGFATVQEMSLHQSRIADIEAVEQPSRVANGEGICVEGVKPPVNPTG
ncbi:MAG TPA: methyltransferase domain-containing protein [Candidatus Acidoferrales bacterium]|nr:methyltransferase domain-containing protein [Candidatus Acidoferrales bacterium]